MLDGDLLRHTVEDINNVTAHSWRLAGRLAGGLQSGAWRVTSPDGAAAVLKVATTSQWSQQILRAERAVRSARSAGYPTPRWLAAGITSAGVGYILQDLAPGRPLTRVGLPEVSALVRVLELQAGLDPDPDRCWSDVITDDLGPGAAALRSAVGTGPEVAALLAACDRLLGAAETGEMSLPRGDLVHGDFRPANVLVEHGHVTAVVDVEALGSGTRVFDYATLLDHEAIDRAALELLVTSATSIAGAAVLRACFVRVALDLAAFLHTRSDVSRRERARRIAALTRRALTIEALSRR